jgi:hypothetical protein
MITLCVFSKLSPRWPNSTVAMGFAYKFGLVRKIEKLSE